MIVQLTRSKLRELHTLVKCARQFYVEGSDDEGDRLSEQIVNEVRPFIPKLIDLAVSVTDAHDEYVAEINLPP